MTIELTRKGDFLEAYGEQARTVAGICNFTITARNGEDMVGIPFHILGKCARLIEDHGHKVQLSMGTHPAMSSHLKGQKTR